MAGRGGARHRLVWTLADQALSSITNFSLVLVAARSQTLAGFGAFAVVVATYEVLLGTTRAATSEVLAVRADDPGDRAPDVASAAGLTLLVGVVGAALLVGAGTLVGDDLGRLLAGLGPLLPGLLLQDLWRHRFFAQGRPHLAAANDAVWFAAQAVGFAALAALGALDGLSVLRCWGVAATVAALVGVGQARLLPRPRGAWSWLRSNRALVPGFVTEFGTQAGAHHLALAGVGAVAGLGAVGVVRTALIPLNVVNVLVVGALAAGVPEAVRLRRRGTPALLRGCAAAAVVLAVTVLGWGLVVATLPPAAVARVVGDGWLVAVGLVAPLALHRAALAAAVPALAALRALRDVRGSTTSRVLVAALALVGTIGGAVGGGGRGAAVGMAATSLVGVVVWWRAALRAPTRLEAMRA